MDKVALITGLKGIINQSADIRATQRNNGIHSSVIVYWLVKILSRTTQIFSAFTYKPDSIER